MRLWVAIFAVSWLAASVPAAEPDFASRAAGVTFAVREGDRPDKVRVTVTIDGQSPEIAWDAFLLRFFDFFDRDGNGEMTPVEAAQMLPLPTLPGKEPFAIRYETLDANGDGKATKGEWKAYVNSRGLSAVVGVYQHPSDEDQQLGRIFVTALDVNRDGRVDTWELHQARRQLPRYDLNDDEFLDRKEFLPDAVTAGRTSFVEVRDSENHSGSFLHVNLGMKPAVSIHHSGDPGDALEFSRSEAHDSFQLQGPANQWSIVGSTARDVANLKSAGEFLTAQLKSALGDRASIERSEVEGDLTLTNLLDVFVYADRNQDGRLTLQEWTNYLELVDAGLQAQICICLSDHGHNLFPMVDRDGDGRLNCHELAQLGGPWAKELLDGLPRIMQLEFSAIPVRSWGGITIAGKKPTARTQTPATGPRWFRSLDRNNDGFVSRREFVGPPEVFQKLDKNQDGLVGSDEVESS